MQDARCTCVSPKQSPLHPANIVEIASSLREPHRKRTPGPNSGQGLRLRASSAFAEEGKIAKCVLPFPVGGALRRWILILIRSGGVCWVTMQESVLILTL